MHEIFSLDGQNKTTAKQKHACGNILESEYELCIKSYFITPSSGRKSRTQPLTTASTTYNPCLYYKLFYIECHLLTT